MLNTSKILESLQLFQRLAVCHEALTQHGRNARPDCGLEEHREAHLLCPLLVRHQVGMLDPMLANQMVGKGACLK